jgi:hypothetical protein
MFFQTVFAKIKFCKDTYTANFWLRQNFCVKLTENKKVVFGIWEALIKKNVAPNSKQSA